jgi:hypothetical protein
MSANIFPLALNARSASSFTLVLASLLSIVFKKCRAVHQWLKRASSLSWVAKTR